MSFMTGFSFGMFIQAVIVTVLLHQRPESVDVEAGIQNCVMFGCLTVFYLFLESRNES